MTEDQGASGADRRRHDRDVSSEIDRLFGGDVVELAAPAGRFEQIVREARHRRRRKALVAGATAAAVMVAVAGVAVGAVRTDRPQGSSTALPAAQRSSGSAEPSTLAATTGTTPASTPPRTTRPAATGLAPGGPVPAGFRAQSVSTAAHGLVYALGDVPGCGNAVCTSLTRTLDGGRTWRGVQPPRVRIDTDPAGGTDPATVSQVRFADARNGWLFGGSLWATHDGSARTGTWRHVDVGGTVLDLASDGRSVWAVVADCSANGSCSRMRLLRSPVGHDDFRDVDGVHVAGPVFDARISLAGGSGTVTAGSRLFVLDGQAWHPAGPPCPDGGGGVVPAADGSSTLVAFCPTDPGAGNVTYVTRRSADLGRSWTTTGDRLRLPNVRTTSFAAASPRDLAVAVGSRDLGGDVWLSHDGGRSWAGAAGLPHLRHGWAWVGAAGAGSYLALPYDATRSVWSGTDGGRQWQEWRIG